ncbi:MAG: flagellar basal body rod protein FlgC [Planctomycetaceae bacterium]|nr:flagellar basal body rod protein FlgC [Planctomycetaceae bacterium]
MSKILSGMAISASGLSAERLRMEVVAGNIANAHSVGSRPGEAYRRQQVSFRSMLNATGEGPMFGGVEVTGVTQDESPLPMVFDPGHVAANDEGFIELPNVQIPMELVDLVTASRAYEANLKSLQIFRQMAEESLTLLRGLG